MSDTAIVPPPRRQVYLRKHERPNIKLPDGDVLMPRAKFARSIGLSDDTVRDMNLPTVIVAAVAHVRRNASLMAIASRTKRRNEPPARRRRLPKRFAK
jgi:hypothetical protein